MKKHVVNEMRSVGMSGVEAETAFDAATGAIERLIERGEPVRLPGVGTLARKTRNAMRRRNPQNGELIEVGARDLVTLRNPRKF